MRQQHHELRMNGYLDLYKKLYNSHRLPFYIVSLWNATILVLQTLMQHFYPDNFAKFCIEGDKLSPMNSLCAIITLEVCILFGISTSYIGKEMESILNTRGYMNFHMPLIEISSL